MHSLMEGGPDRSREGVRDRAKLRPGTFSSETGDVGQPPLVHPALYHAYFGTVETDYHDGTQRICHHGEALRSA
jgi:hypothetical protein